MARQIARAGTLALPRRTALFSSLRQSAQNVCQVRNLAHPLSGLLTANQGCCTCVGVSHLEVMTTGKCQRQDDHGQLCGNGSVYRRKPDLCDLSEAPKLKRVSLRGYSLSSWIAVHSFFHGQIFKCSHGFNFHPQMHDKGRAHIFHVVSRPSCHSCISEEDPESCCHKIDKIFGVRDTLGCC